MDYLQNLFGLSGKVAVVTGASRGLGRASALALSAAGADVVLVGRDVAALEQTKRVLSGESLVVEADVTNADDRARVLDATMKRFGKIDILVNNAGIIRRASVLEYSIEDWDDVIATNLTAVFALSQACAKLMVANGGGKIINIASLVSFSGGMNIVAYSAAKGGVAQLTKAMANELAKYHVNVNAIAPGYFETDATAGVRENPERMSQLLSRIPMGRFGKPDELGGAFVFLASSASDYMTGHILTVDGGFNSY